MKRKEIKKGLLLFLSVLLSFAIFSGCGKDGISSILDKNPENTISQDGSSTEQSGTITGDITSLDSLSDLQIDVPENAVSGGYTGDVTGTVTFSEDSVSFSGSGISADGKNVTISQEGSYILRGTCTDGSVTVNISKEDKINLYFDGIDLTSKTSSPINIVSSDKTTIILVDGSVNILRDGNERTVDENGDPDATLWSKDDLDFTGAGSLYVVANCSKGIHSKDDIEINSGEIYVISTDDGIKGNDSVKISGGKITLKSGADGIKSDNEDTAGKGFVSITGGEINITSAEDGIQGYRDVTISNGTINIVTGGGSKNSASKSNDNNMGFGGMFGGRGGRPGESHGQQGNTSDSATTDEESSKAIKSDIELLISGGNITIDSKDDAIHSNANVTVKGGTITASTGDDGIHADLILTIDDGKIDIIKSYEGLEGEKIFLNGGTMNVTSTDDGINAAGNSTTAETEQNGQNGGRGGFGGFGAGGSDTDLNASLVITGGTGIFNCQGDGLDSNNTIEMTGGNYIIYGPTNGGNGSLDYARTFVMTGGSLAAFGSTGMAQGVSSGSTVGYLFVQLSGAANSELIIENESGDEIFKTTSPKQYGCVFISNPEINSGSNYTFFYNGENLGTLAAR